MAAAEPEPQRKPARTAVYNPGQAPLCLRDLRHIVRRLNELQYPDDCPVQVTTPLPPRDRRCVGFKVFDYSTTQLEGKQQ